VFYPADGAPMEEVDGLVACSRCSTVFPGPLIHQLIELHLHGAS
jgi:hypothetical protein